jgi:hypothetical protein
MKINLLKLTDERYKKMKNRIIASIAVLLIAIAGVFTGFTFGFSPNDVQTISGTITSVDHPIAKMKSDDGSEYTIYMGPYWFWRDNGYSLQTNANVQVKGEVKGNDLYPWEIIQDGKTMTFTDSQGIPKWSNGKCKYRDGSGYGRGNRDCPRWKNK